MRDDDVEPDIRIGRAVVSLEHRPVGSPAGGTEAAQPCMRCGEETAVGSVFFSDRQLIELRQGGHAYLCSLCNAQIRGSRRNRQRTEDEVRKLVDMGAILDINWWRM